MRRARGLITSALLLLAMAGPADAGDRDRPSRPERVQPDLIALSGMQAQIRHVPRHVLTGYDHASSQVPKTRQAQVRRILTQALDADQLERRVVARISQDLSREHATKIREWLRSDFGRKIVKLEEHAWSPENASQRASFAAKLAGAPPSPARQQLVRRLDLATGTTETLLESAELSAFGAAMALDSTRPKGDRVGEDRIRVQIDQERQATRERCQAVVATTFLYAYQHLSDGDLFQYAEFLESEAGRGYHMIADTTLNDALYEQGEALSRALVGLTKGPQG